MTYVRDEFASRACVFLLILCDTDVCFLVDEQDHHDFQWNCAVFAVILCSYSRTLDTYIFSGE